MARILTHESTLSTELDRLASESSILSRIWKYELYAGGALILAGVVSGLLAALWWPTALGAILLFLGGAHYAKRGEIRADRGRFEGGAEGEKEVTKTLETQLPETYLIMNDITVRSGTKQAQNDHIVLGPNGVFVIETKAYSGTMKGSADEDMLQQTKEYKGKVTTGRIKNPIPQNEYHLRIVGERMKEGGFVTDDLKSVIVFSNRRARIEIEGAKVPVIKPYALPSTILSSPSSYTYDEEYLQRLAAFLAIK